MLGEKNNLIVEKLFWSFDYLIFTLSRKYFILKKFRFTSVNHLGKLFTCSL